MEAAIFNGQCDQMQNCESGCDFNHLFCSTFIAACPSGEAEGQVWEGGGDLGVSLVCETGLVEVSLCASG